MKNPNVIFCTERYCDGKAEMGPSNTHHNVISSFKHSHPDIPFNIIHYDELFERKVHIDDVLLKICNKFDANIVVYSLMNKYAGSPSVKSFEQMKKNNISNVIMWPDCGIDWGYPQVEQLGNLIDLHVGWDNATSEFHKTRKMPPNFQQMWVPQDEKLYFKPENQEIPISFIGSTHIPERQHYLKCAVDAGAPILIRGGQRQEKLTAEQYAQLIRQTKISINFPWCLGNFDQIKGRVYEVLASGGLLFERKNEATSKLFTPGVDYVDFENPKEFIEKMSFYLNNEAERVKIAEQGHKTYLSKYTAKRFWEKILYEIL